MHRRLHCENCPLVTRLELAKMVPHHRRRRRHPGYQLPERARPGEGSFGATQPRDAGVHTITEQISSMAKYYVGVQPTDGRLYPKVINLDMVFLYPEYWRAVPDGSNLKEELSAKGRGDKMLKHHLIEYIDEKKEDRHTMNEFRDTVPNRRFTRSPNSYETECRVWLWCHLSNRPRLV
ncbi:hypothetical protein GGR57DRAFT_511015 [Xylariaceae sp. FL1272]|nr:hypothetical protein GGR57DRAFT_511015 [Xylariaceae sp. FL1272]